MPSTKVSRIVEHVKSGHRSKGFVITAMTVVNPAGNGMLSFIL